MGLPSVVQLDCYRLTGSTRWRSVVITFLRNRPFRPIVTLRLYQACKRRPWLRILRYGVSALHWLVCWIAAIDLPPNTRIGAGFAIYHGWGLVINGEAKIGRNVTVLHGATIGKADRISPDGTRTPGWPIIEDMVSIGPGAAVVGGVTVGRGSRILPGAVVFKDVAAATMVGGNPGKAIKSDVPPDGINFIPA